MDPAAKERSEDVHWEQELRWRDAAHRHLVPTDVEVERVVGELPGLMRGSAVALGVRSPNGTEDLVIVAAVDPSSWRILDEIRKTVRARVLEYFGVTVSDVCLVAPGIPKTSSGKVQRAACRARYEADSLELVEGSRDAFASRFAKPSAASRL
jgi:fatty-acyl-CoA synthase